MKNDEFRKLVTASRKDDGSPPQSVAARALGGKKSSFAGMTPRPGKAVSNADFARQIREQHASLQPAKKFKSSAPKGSKFAAGYTDRAKARQDAEDEEDDKTKRIKALEEQVKLDQLPLATFEALRDEILGGDASSTHLVKGLDRKLLERVRRGEDVLGLRGDSDTGPPPDVDDELDKLGEKEVETVAREKSEKKGVKTSQPVAGVKRSRDEIMAELKAQRKAAAEAKAAAAPTFDSRWRRIGDPARPKIEIDHKGREVLITVDENGVVKKKIRKTAGISESETKATIDMPDASKPVLGADVAVPQRLPQEQESDDDDDDIFEGAGTEYNPLGDMDDDSDEDAEDNDGEKMTGKPIQEIRDTDQERSSAEEEKPKPEQISAPLQSTGPRNYFGDTANEAQDPEQDRFKGIENVLKKAAEMDAPESKDDEDNSESREERDARLAKRARMLAQEDRDLEDMDMGFGSSRGFDEEDGDGENKKQRLSQWKGSAAAHDDGWDDNDGEGSTKKKRKGKKRKGDVNNVDDIMRVIEGRKSGAASK